jgi:hypothetical protein
VKNKVVAALRARGFRVHEEEDAATNVSSLGYSIGGVVGHVAGKSAKVQKVCLCCRWLRGRPRISGRQLHRLVGHAVHLLLPRRELLCVFRAT